jgi:hypothetical protein
MGGVMQPYYEHAGITIFCADCRDILPSLKADVVVTDPPYNVGIRYGSETDDNRADYAKWTREWFVLAMATSKALAVTPGIVNVGLWCSIQEPAWIVAWHKPAAMGRSPFGFCNWEPVLVYGKGWPRNGVDVITAGIVPNSELAGHPCPKPVGWGRGLVSLLTSETDTILDPFMGSGTTLVAAKQLGRKAIGIEIEERYCEIACKRLSQEVLPLSEPTPEPEQAGLL